MPPDPIQEADRCQSTACSPLSALVAGLAAVGPAAAMANGGHGKRALRMNEIQVIGTHNSYHRELSKAERVAHDAIYGAPIYDGFLAYSHASLPNQFSRQRAASSSISSPIRRVGCTRIRCCGSGSQSDR